MLGKLSSALACLLAADTGFARDTELFVQGRAGSAAITHFRINDDAFAGQLLAGARWGSVGVASTPMTPARLWTWTRA